MVIDIDHFKHINDSFGHAVGDAVLRDAAASLRASARREDSVSRIGGEEFLVICPIPISGALKSAERLRASLEAKQIAIGQANKTSRQHRRGCARARNRGHRRAGQMADQHSMQPRIPGATGSTPGSARSPVIPRAARAWRPP